MAKQTITITTKEENPEPVELIAESLINISEGFKRLESSNLSKRAVVLLLHDLIGATKINKKEIELVLKHAPDLAWAYLKKLPPTDKKK